ncbi:MAG: VanW family protein [Negativicutes bacterium]|nr:VanW family protein [Negativicutes bacterium]
MIVLLGLGIVVMPLFGSNIYAGVSLDGVAVGGKSREEVRQLLNLWRPEYRSRQVVAYYGDTLFHVDAAGVDYDLDVEATADEVWSYGRRGPWWQRLQNIYAARRDGYRVPVRVRYNEGKLLAMFDHWRETIDRPPRNAALSLLGGGITPQEQGRRLEVESLKPLVLQALEQPTAARLALPVTPLYPDITTADIEQTGLKEVLADYTTFFDASDGNRSANIRLAARKINGYIVYPGKTFSFNAVVGPRDKEHGFKEALEIVDGEYVPGIGGGICQVSSTLYNSVLLSNLTVVERTNHSKPLGYVGLGRDATVAYDILDFRFVNNTDEPVMILAETDGNQLAVGMVGQKPLPEKVEVVAVDRKVIAPAIVKKPDAELYLGETKVEKQGKPGYEITTLRLVRSGGREIKREVLAKDRYLPEDTIIKVGTKVPPFVHDKPPASGKEPK